MTELLLGVPVGDGPERIAGGIKKRMGEGVKVRVERVDRIPRDASGKYRYVVSKVARAGLPAGPVEGFQ